MTVPVLADEETSAPEEEEVNVSPTATADEAVLADATTSTADVAVLADEATSIVVLIASAELLADDTALSAKRFHFIVKDS